MQAMKALSLLSRASLWRHRRNCCLIDDANVLTSGPKLTETDQLRVAPTGLAELSVLHKLIVQSTEC